MQTMTDHIIELLSQSNTKGSLQKNKMVKLGQTSMTPVPGGLGYLDRYKNLPIKVPKYDPLDPCLELSPSLAILFL